ncbi:MAG: tetratricopeptide repeat protein [Cyanobacteria bacterium]|nr:tetratricopeptide repeat protein [Cyanobacteriota bacterium]
MHQKQGLLFGNVPFVLTSVLTTGLALVALPVIVLPVSSPTWAETTPAVKITPLQLSTQALAEERLGHRDTAVQLYRQAFEKAPDDVLLCVKLAALLANTGQLNEAVSLYQRATRMDSTDGMLELSLGSLYEQRGELTEAKQAYARALQKSPEYLYTWFNLARVNVLLKDYEQAIDGYERFLKAYPEQFDAQRHLAQLYLVTHQDNKAKQAFSLLKQNYPKRFSDYLSLAKAQNRSDSPQDALLSLQQAIAREGDKADIAEEMGVAHQILGQNEFAVQDFERALGKNPGKWHLYEPLAQLYRAQGQKSKAVEAVQAFLKQDPSNDLAHHLLADLWVETAAYDKAIPELDYLLKQSVQVPKGGFSSEKEKQSWTEQQYTLKKQRAYAFQMRNMPGDLETAIGSYQALLNESSFKPWLDKDRQLKTNLAIAYHQNKQWDLATQLYKAVLESQIQDKPNLKESKQDRQKRLAGISSLKQDYVAALMAAADACVAAGTQCNPEKAQNNYQEALQWAPKNYTPALLGLARLTAIQHKPEEAISWYQKILVIDPKHLPARLALAELYQQTGQSDASLTLLRGLHQDFFAANPEKPVVAVKPNSEEEKALRLLASQSLDRGDLEMAFSVFKELTQIQPSDPVLWYGLGYTEQQRQHFPEAKIAYETAIHLNNRDVPSLFNLATLYDQSGEWPKAQEMYRLVLIAEPDRSDAWYGLGVVHDKQQHFEEALNAYQRYLQANVDKPNRPEYWQQADERIKLLKDYLSRSRVKPNSSEAKPSPKKT